MVREGPQHGALDVDVIVCIVCSSLMMEVKHSFNLQILPRDARPLRESGSVFCTLQNRLTLLKIPLKSPCSKWIASKIERLLGAKRLCIGTLGRCNSQSLMKGKI